jgi:EmrB/QacA subfamily drug resistance transporter
MQTIALPLAGKLTDRWGRKRLFLWAVVLFTIGSMGAGVSPNIYVLIAFRIVQAMGGGMFFPCAAGVVSDVFAEKRQTAIGLFATIFQLGGIIGPNIGGFITDGISWRWIFFVNLPIGIAILLLGLRFIPRDKLREADFSQQLDGAGAGMFAGGMFAVLFGLTYLASHPHDFASPTPWVFLALGFGLLVLFIRHESRVEQPIIDMQLIRWRPFFAANAQIFMGSASFNGFFNFMPYYATIAYGMSATQSGALMTPRSIAAVVVSILVSIFVLRRGYRRPWLLGGWLFGGSMIVTSLGLADVSLLGFEPSNFLLLSFILFVSGVGMGMGAPSSQNASLDLLPDKIAAAAGIRAMFGNSGGVLGTTLVTLVLSQFDDKVSGMRYIFLGLGCTNLLSQMWIFMIPDTARQRWKEGRGQAIEREPVVVEIGG